MHRVRRPSAGLVMLAAMLLASGTAGATEAVAETVRSVPGRLVVPREQQLVWLDPRTGVEEPLPLEGSGAIGDAAADPTGRRVAFSRLARRDDGALGRNVYVVASRDDAPVRVIADDVPRIFLGSPSFGAEGASIFFDRQDPTRPPADARVEEFSLTTGAKRVVATDARMPTPHPDGGSLAFVRWGVTESLVARSLRDDSELAIVDIPSFLAIAAPRFSPDGAWIAFSAVGDISARRPFHVLGGARLGSAVARPQRHGFPWEIWRVRPDGSELTRLTELGEDEPTVAWSPDGRTLAVFGGLGLTLVDVTGADPPRALANGGTGGIGWLPAE